MTSACAVLLLAAFAVDVDVDVDLLDGTTHAGRLISLSSDQVVLQKIDGQVTLATRKLLTLVPLLPEEEDVFPDAIIVDLVDGSELRCEQFRVEASRATIQFGEDEQTRAATRTIHAVRFKKQNPEVRRQWEEIESDGASADLLVIRKTVESTDDTNLDSLEGVIYDIDDEQVMFEFDGTRIAVPRQKVEGVIYLRRPADRSVDPVCRVVDSVGTAWHLKSLSLKDGALTGVSVGGVRASIPIDRLAKVDFSIGNLVYLSDLTPESIKWTPLIQSRATPSSLEKLFQPQFDRGFFGGPLMLDSESEEKGLSIHSHTVLRYRLTREFKRFAATAGIDDRFRSDGDVTLTITGDGRQLFSQQISGGRPSVQIDLNLSGVRRLTILVDFGEDGMQVGDYLNLCNARLMK